MVHLHLFNLCTRQVIVKSRVGVGVGVAKGYQTNNRKAGRVLKIGEIGHWILIAGSSQLTMVIELGIMVVKLLSGPPCDHAQFDFFATVVK